MLKILDPMEFPREQGETWHYVHPNNANVEFHIPGNAAAVCLRPLLGIFKAKSPYRVTSFDSENGWVTVQASDNDLYKMPLYLFSRHFDAESFVRPAREYFRYNPNREAWSD